MARESVSKTLVVAGLLSVVCSAVVSNTAVLLRPAYGINKELDRKKNILQAAGLFERGRSVEELFGQFEIKVVDLVTGEFRDDIDAATFDATFLVTNGFKYMCQSHLVMGNFGTEFQ